MLTTDKEFARFRVYKSFHPWGNEAEQTAINTAAICNRLQAKGKRLDDQNFRPTRKPKRVIDHDAIEQQMESFARAHNRKLGRSGHNEHGGDTPGQ
jgi:hypothetical protein